MGTTRRGLPVQTSSADAIEAIDAFTDRLARIDPGVDEVLVAVEREPEVVSLQLCAAMLFLYGQTADADALADAHLAAVDPEGANEREQATFAALRHWRDGEFLLAAEGLEGVLRDCPRDLLALKAVEFLYYVMGQHHMAARFLATVDAVRPDNPGDADVLACAAFASELTGLTSAAVDLAEESLAIEPHTPWAQHALAHALIARGDPPEAIDRLRSFQPVWETSGRVVWCHNAWHLGVALLDRLEREAADDVFRQQVWGVQPDTPGEQIDAISYLWRVEMGGWDVDDGIWSDVADHVEARTGECVFPFLSAHHGYALARAGRTDALAALRRSVAARVARGDGEATRVWEPVGVAVVEASIAHGAGDRAGAAALLDPVMEGVTAVGGSDAQVDLFRQAYLTALVAAGRRDDARRQLDRMTTWKAATSPLDERFAAAI